MKSRSELSKNVQQIIKKLHQRESMRTAVTILYYRQQKYSHLWNSINNNSFEQLPT